MFPPQQRRNYLAINNFLLDLAYLNQYNVREYNYEARRVEYAQILNCRNQLECFKQLVYHINPDFGEKGGNEDDQTNRYFDPEEQIAINNVNPFLSTSLFLDKCNRTMTVLFYLK